MIANLKVNIILGFVAFLFTYLFSVANNTWQTSLFRAFLGFLIFFILGFALSFILKQKEAKKHDSMSESPLNVTPEKVETEQKKLVDKELKSEPSFQSIPLNSLHNLGNGKDTQK
jgi:uncharacterized membrane protein YraQ (UPF0718 family)